jgi:hypothetical protein
MIPDCIVFTRKSDEYFIHYAQDEKCDIKVQRVMIYLPLDDIENIIGRIRSQGGAIITKDCSYKLGIKYEVNIEYEFNNYQDLARKYKFSHDKTKSYGYTKFQARSGNIIWRIAVADDLVPQTPKKI